MYKLLKNPQGEINSVLRIADSAAIPFTTENGDYRTYLKWLDGYEYQMTGPAKYEWVKTSDGNEPLPADE